MEGDMIVWYIFWRDFRLNIIISPKSRLGQLSNGRDLIKMEGFERSYMSGNCTRSDHYE
jgi:hypothetical protein